MENNTTKDLPSIMAGDPQRLRQIMLNLAGNAVKYTRKGQVAVTITCPETTETHHILKLVVEDTGPGMTEDTLKKLFQPFYQADDGTVRQSKGTGLGLSITRELVELMDGDINVESSPGEGTRVEVSLMLEKEQDMENGRKTEADASHQHGLRTGKRGTP